MKIRSGTDIQPPKNNEASFTRYKTRILCISYLIRFPLWKTTKSRFASDWGLLPRILLHNNGSQIYQYVTWRGVNTSRQKINFVSLPNSNQTSLRKTGKTIKYEEGRDEFSFELNWIHFITPTSLTSSSLLGLIKELVCLLLEMVAGLDCKSRQENVHYFSSATSQ